MGTPIKRSIRTIQQHQHCTVPSTTSIMKFAIVSIVLVAAVSINGEGVLVNNGMQAIFDIIGNIDGMSKAATDLNTMESRLEGLQDQNLQVENALEALTDNLDKTGLGTNTMTNDHTNMKKETPGEEESAWVPVTQG